MHGARKHAWRTQATWAKTSYTALEQSLKKMKQYTFMLHLLY